jgi:hypothetical protein
MVNALRVKGGLPSALILSGEDSLPMVVVRETRRISAKNDGNPNADVPFHLVVGNEGLWWPYRSMCRALFQMQRDRALVLAVHRKMVDEVAAILRLEQDMVLQLSTKVLECIADAGGRETSGRGYSVETNNIFDHAIACIRELGEAVINTQIRSLEAMRDNSKARDDTNAMPAITKVEYETLDEERMPEPRELPLPPNVHALST